MKPQYRIVSDLAEIERRKVADRLAFLALPPRDAQQQVDLGLTGPFREFDEDDVGLGRGLTDEEDGRLVE